jgi:predicted component of type VI protein secretion system
LTLAPRKTILDTKTRMWYDLGMAANDVNEAIGRARKVRKLIAGIDLMVEAKVTEMYGSGDEVDLETIWRSAALFVRRQEFNWDTLADELEINRPSHDTIVETLFGIDERIVILNRRARPGNVIALRR